MALLQVMYRPLIAVFPRLTILRHPLRVMQGTKGESSQRLSIPSRKVNSMRVLTVDADNSLNPLQAYMQWSNAGEDTRCRETRTP
jgi:hypothetical protein